MSILCVRVKYQCGLISVTSGSPKLTVRLSSPSQELALLDDIASPGDSVADRARVNWQDQTRHIGSLS